MFSQATLKSYVNVIGRFICLFARDVSSERKQRLRDDPKQIYARTLGHEVAAIVKSDG